MNARRIGALFVMALLAGCGSTPPTQWYLLSAEPALAAAVEGPTVGIVSLEVAEYLLATQVLSMEGANRVRRAEFSHWAEPLDKGIARVLVLDLGAAIGTQGVRLGPWPREWLPQHELRVRIQRLDASEGSVDLVAAWSVQDGGHGSPPRDRLTRLTQPRSGSDAAAIAADFSTLLRELAGVIAAELANGAG